MTESIRLGLFVFMGILMAVVYWYIVSRLGVREKARVHLATVLVFGIAFGYYFTAVKPLTGMLPRGLDLEGGVHVVLEAVPTAENPVTDEAIVGAMQVIDNPELRKVAGAAEGLLKKVFNAVK